MSILLELAAKAESSLGADRALDAEIELATGNWTQEHYEAWHLFQECGEAANPPLHEPVPPRRLTGSLDAVLTLIDPTEEWDLSTQHCIARATVGIARDHLTSWPGYGEHAGCDPVLALLAAALRAIHFRALSHTIEGASGGE